MDFLIRFVQVHESFRKPEIEALAILANVDVQFLYYCENTSFSIVRLANTTAAHSLLSRSILCKSIHELWGTGSTYDSLHTDIKTRTRTLWPAYTTSSFKFDFDTFSGSRPLTSQRAIIQSFQYMNFRGPIALTNPDETFTVFEEYDYSDKKNDFPPRRIYLGRYVASSHRKSILEYSLKKREYINTTSMDSELALLSANLTLARPGSLFYDPFVGTGSFPIACSHFGAVTIGSDIDGRMVRGKEGKDIRSNFRQYGLLDKYLDGFIADLTHCPLRAGGRRWIDGIVCDPPYGVREGLKVLGTKGGGRKEAVYINGEAAHLQDKYIPPKKAYSFEAMLDDLLDFAAEMLVDDGRLSFWMPTANDEDTVLEIPTHPCLVVVSVCMQVFNKWSRRLLTYKRLPDADIDNTINTKEKVDVKEGTTANDLNSFRKRYFEGFKTSSDAEPSDQGAPKDDVT
ncbi:hypothetical protein ACLMJK_003954 [Lecanora helva]